MSRFESSLLSRALDWARGTPEPVESDDIQDIACDIAEVLCAEYEGFSGPPYLDLMSGVPTIGYGATHYLDGRRVKLTDPAISRESAQRLLRLMIQREYLPIVLKLCPNIRGAKKLAAILDWTYNLGGSNLAASTLRRKILAEMWDEVPDQMRRWVNAGGILRRGLVRRREAEVALVNA